MVKFNELYIDQTGDNLIIDVSVLDLPYYASDKIKAIYVIPEYNFQEGSVSGYVWKATVSGHTDATGSKKTIPNNTTSYRVVIPQADLKEVEFGELIGLEKKTTTSTTNGVTTTTTYYVRDECDELGYLPTDLSKKISIHLEDHLFFVYVETSQETVVSTGIPCYLDKKYTIGVVFYKGIIKRNMMQGVKEIEATCNIPKYFIDLHLRLTALEASIETDNFKEAIKYYKMFFLRHTINQSNVQPCNCGR